MCEKNNTLLMRTMTASIEGTILYRAWGSILEKVLLSGIVDTVEQIWEWLLEGIG